MTIKAIRESLEQARDEGLPWLNTRGQSAYVSIRPGAHEAKLYSICEGLIVEIERLQARVDELERVQADHARWVGMMRPIGSGPTMTPPIGTRLGSFDVSIGRQDTVDPRDIEPGCR